MRFALLLLCAAGLYSGPVSADEAPEELSTVRVVELFTSQGCSSCPPANELVNRIADEPGTLALSYGVTYWDYLGWKDTFAHPEFTDRQRDYGQAFDMASLYTPQIVLNGSSHDSRYTDGDVRSMALDADGPKTELFMGEAGLEANIKNTDVKYHAVLVEYVHGPQTVPVGAGENRGRTLKLSNVVTDVESLGDWDTGMTRDIIVKEALEDGKSYALLLHDKSSGEVASAATYIP